MNVIEQSFDVLDWSNLNLYERVETAARVCRQSESNGDAEGFVSKLIRRGHYPVLEFARIVTGMQETANVRRIREQAAEGRVLAKVWQERLYHHYPAFFSDMDGHEEGCDAPVVIDNSWIPVLITTSRTISHQLVRYRHDVCYMQESQRHCRYDKNGIDVIAPELGRYFVAWNTWNKATQYAENAYIDMMKAGAKAEQARAVLPGCTATRILVYASPDEWRHIFEQRCDSHADPQMQALMYPLRTEMQERQLI